MLQRHWSSGGENSYLHTGPHRSPQVPPGLQRLSSHSPQTCFQYSRERRDPDKLLSKTSAADRSVAACKGHIDKDQGRGRGIPKGQSTCFM